MALPVKYILGFANDLNEFYEIYFRKAGFLGDPLPIFGTADCLTLRSTAGDQNKFEPILGTEALINIVVGKVNVDGITWDNDQLTIDDLIAEHDNDIPVDIYKDQDYTKTVFSGFIVVEDNSQPFLDPPFALSVRALDGLGLLKGNDLKDQNGDVFSGVQSVVSWVMQILYKTGLTLNLRTYFDFRNTISLSTDALIYTKLNSNTFKSRSPGTTTDPTVDLVASEADDCYTALEKMVRCFRCRLFQEDGVWNLVNLDQYANGFNYIEYAIDGVSDGLVTFSPINKGFNVIYDIPVGHDEVIHPVNEDAVRYLKLATKWQKFTYSYDQSLNKICNEDLTQGVADPTHDGTISSSIQDPSINPVVIFDTKAYNAFCFDHFDNNDSAPGNQHAYPSIAPANSAYIRSVVDSLGYELDRYIVLEQTTNQATYLRTSKFQIDSFDVLQFSFDWRTKNNLNTVSATSYVAAYVYLYGIDGSFYGLRSIADNTIPGNPNVWQVTDSNFHRAVNTASPFVSGPEIFDTAANGWISVSVNSSGASSSVKAPVSGDIEILFVFQSSIPGGEAWIKNISVKILPFLQGSYTQLKGDFNYSLSSNNIKQTDSQDVEISDSPKRYFKGALLQSDGLSLMPTTWQRPGDPANYRFTQAMEKIVFNNENRIVEKIEGAFRGLTYTDASLTVRQSGYLGRYYFVQHPEPTKKFILTSFEKDYATGIGRHVFVEILKDQNDTGWQAPDDYLFQYIFQ